ncbi:MAG: hypothetical protein ACRDGG_00425 [Anaerolineae bacterium]
MATLALLCVTSLLLTSAPPLARSSARLDSIVYLPIAMKTACDPIPGTAYRTLAPTNPAVGVDMETHPDVNPALRGYELTDAFKGLVTYSGSQDPNAPQLPWLFADRRTGVFSNVYQVHAWDWGCNCRGPVYTDPEVTLAGLATTPGETIHVPDSGYDIGDGNDVMVLYASANRITLKYTREDDVITGYTIHLEKVCVEPSLLAMYRSLNAAGRGQLPALRGGQALGRAIGSEIGVVVRDTGSFMDPRSRNSWWTGR